jgi:hypothetical protein
MVSAHWTPVASEVLSVERVLFIAKTILHTSASFLFDACSEMWDMVKVLLHLLEVSYNLCSAAKSSATQHKIGPF